MLGTRVLLYVWLICHRAIRVIFVGSKPGVNPEQLRLGSARSRVLSQMMPR